MATLTQGPHTSIKEAYSQVQELSINPHQNPRFEEEKPEGLVKSNVKGVTGAIDVKTSRFNIHYGLMGRKVITANMSDFSGRNIHANMRVTFDLYQGNVPKNIR